MSAARPSYSTTSSGEGGDWYIFRVSYLLKLLRSKFGPPDVVESRITMSDFSKKKEKGILVFDVALWRDATGHVTLWDGHSCSDKCYFPESHALSLWRLK